MLKNDVQTLKKEIKSKNIENEQKKNQINFNSQD